MHNQSNRDLWHNCKRNKKQAKQTPPKCKQKDLARLRTSEEERNYGMIRGSAQATQAALSHSRVQTNPTIERGPPWRPKIKKLSRDKAAEKGTQTKDKEKQM